jgi:hypothetical protein
VVSSVILSKSSTSSGSPTSPSSGLQPPCPLQKGYQQIRCDYIS